MSVECILKNHPHHNESCVTGTEEMSSSELNFMNPFQGKYKRVLCVCSANMLRSPTCALVLSNEPFNFNTRSCGVDDMALIPVTERLVLWADELVCFEDWHEKFLKERTNKRVINLHIPDNFEYRSKDLMFMIRKRYEEAVKEKQGE